MLPRVAAANNSGVPTRGACAKGSQPARPGLIDRIEADNPFGPRVSPISQSLNRKFAR